MVSNKPGVLLVTTSPLLPPNAGGRIYTWGTTEPLSDRFTYHLIALATPEELEEFDGRREELTERYGSVFETFRLYPRPPIPGHLSRRDALRHLWFHTRHRLPLMDVSYYSAEVVDRARALIAAGSVDVIEVDHAQLAYVRRFVPEVPAILVNHNIEGDLHPFWMTDRWSLPELVVWRAFASISRRNTRRVEIQNSYGFSSKLFISESDAERVSNDCPKLFLPVPMPSGPQRQVRQSGPVTLLWLGGFDWPPNLEGMVWFLREVWPRLAASEEPSYRLEIAGANPPARISEHHDGERVVVHGYVDDITDMKDRADVFIAPLLSGGGVRVKVVEALAAGIPVVTTSKGAEGLAVEVGRDLLVADTPEAFADYLSLVGKSAPTRERLSRAAQAYVREVHDPLRVAIIKAGALLDAIRSSGEPVG